MQIQFVWGSTYREWTVLCFVKTINKRTIQQYLLSRTALKLRTLKKFVSSFTYQEVLLLIV